MSFRRELRALRYVQQGNVLKLKSYLRRHRHLLLDKPLLNGQSLLHSACALHEDACALLLLRRGANPLNTDCAGNNALHFAAIEARKGWKEAYSDLVVPILRRCPDALDAPNHQGTTPRDILKQVEQLLFNQPHCKFSLKDTFSADMSSWQQKLMAESMDEYQETYGQYEDDFSCTTPEAETFEAWADRISREYQARHCKPRHFATQPQTAHVGNEVKQKEKQKYLESKKQMDKELHHAQRYKYQKQCDEFFGRLATTNEDCIIQADEGQRNTSKDEECCSKIDPEEENDSLSKSKQNTKTCSYFLGYNDIPWPVKGGTAEQMAQFIAAGADPSNSSAYKRYLRAQQVTWHPDRFLQRCGSRLQAQDMDRVLGTVTALSQELNRIAEQVK